MQRLGQHFLNNEAVIKKTIDTLALREDKTVIEIGPGRGAITVPLAAACDAVGARLVTIEKDPTLADALAKTVDAEMVTGDALKLLAAIVAAATQKNKNYAIVGNIPYYITGKLLRIISELHVKPRECVLMLQREVAERICAEAPDMNRLSASVQFWADVGIIAMVPKNDFVPPPNVDSAVIVLAKKSVAANIDTDHYYAAVRALFAQPRKTILNNLAAADQKKTKVHIETILDELGIKAEARPQDLSVEKIIAIAGAMGITL